VDTYSTYDAKARFSEILRKVRAGKRVVVTHHGERVAEIRPIEAERAGLAERMARLERDGGLKRAAKPGGALPTKAIARRTGALTRFLASRD